MTWHRTPEHAVVAALEAVRRQLLERQLRAEPVPLAYASGAYAPPNGTPWQVLREAIAAARAGRWDALNALERKMAPEQPLHPRGIPWPCKWLRVGDVLEHGRLIGYTWSTAAASCEDCDGSGRVDAETETRRPHTVEVDCPTCDGDGQGDLPADAPVIHTNLAGELVELEALLRLRVRT